MNSNLDRLNQTFEEMRQNGWDISLPLRWSFFFVDSAREKLLVLFEELKGREYIMEALYQSDDGDEWTLQATKSEALSPDKLHRRNVAFNELAEYCGVSLYDGWDVEKEKGDP